MERRPVQRRCLNFLPLNLNCRRAVNALCFLRYLIPNHCCFHSFECIAYLLNGAIYRKAATTMKHKKLEFVASKY